MRSLLAFEKIINRFSDLLGWMASTLFIILMFNVFYDVVMRYAFNHVSIAMQEMEWHLFSAVFLLGVPYALKAGGHVRVDVFYERFTLKTRAIIDLLGTLFFLLPFCILVYWYGVDYMKESYSLGESSGDPGGLPYRWLIKGLIPLSFLFMAISGIGMLLHNINRLVNPSLFHEK
ncbi:TRAP transporter small permease subunit [Photobacterium sp. WH77]|uniref:TRAP transporter small permease protein n=1 Tax=Photobacterium arenosum TaxID=2774143 RepID=A0ABR9BMX6_9GAMM|nr:MULTISPECIES: TRAP transporter small permease subunit [Photobacterium]MBD8513924.1 TRAP transporter small permease subunit [Photobacterium arenosum]MBV7262434.1 TRAP transporter small permease subunit [Photobacterium sp. WH24]MCG2836324.1 TRAP transporter small permease subunit [Photobacterium sp. WH77]MCG2844049.1 TRAP transporter small permease subunit [Photobacterium sp. WH80]MDO6580475.1 TRAP transporter small permease subunit [Photobacterium sp. 2_MG-2023]